MVRLDGAEICLLVALAACTVAPPQSSSGGGGGAGQVPGDPFEQNLCFQCALRSCSIAANACTQEASCARWLDCVGACPTDQSGVAAEGECLRRCGLPLSAEVLFGCVQDFANDVLLGCERACTPP